MRGDGWMAKGDGGRDGGDGGVDGGLSDRRDNDLRMVWWLGRTGTRLEDSE